jgi:hypothetical protein
MSPELNRLLLYANRAIVPGDTLGKDAHSRSTGDNLIGDLIRVLLILVAGLAHSVCKLHAGSLLDDVGCLVRCGVETGHTAEGDPLTAGIGFGAQTSGNFGRLTPDMGHNAAKIMPWAEGPLDPIEVRQGAGGSGGPVPGNLAYAVRICIQMHSHSTETVRRRS